MERFKRLFAILLMFIMILSFNISVYAVNSDMSGSGESSGSESASKGFSVESNIGYRVYVLDNEGNTVANKVTDILYHKYTANAGSWKTQTGSSTSKVETSAAEDMKMPRVLKEENNVWLSNFDTLKEWLLSDNEDYGQTNLSYIIENYLGEDVVEEFNSRDDYYFIIEPIFNCGVFTGRSSNSYAGMYYGTSRNWINLYINNKIGTGSFLGNVVYTTMANCVYTNNDYNDISLYAPTDFSDKSAEELLKHTYGLGLFWNNEFSKGKTPSIHTWDYNLDTQPGKAPLPDDEQDYQDIIICKYYEDYEDNKLAKTESFFRPSEPKLINIEDEPEYKVAEWFTTSTDLKNKDYSANWKDSVKDKEQIQNGIKPEEIELNSPEKILFIRLVRGIEVPPREIDYVLTESEISTNASIKADDRVRFSLPSEEGTYNVGILANGSNNVFNKFNGSNLVSVYKSSGAASKTLYNLSGKLNIYREGDNLQLADANADLNDIYNTESINNRATSDYTKDITVSFKNATSYNMSGSLKDKTAKLLVKVYSGSNKEQASTDYDKHEVYGESSYITNTQSKLIEFRPYIRMSYKTNTNEKQYVNVQGKYIRSLCMPSIVAVYYDKQPTLNISSNMWSIDNKLTNGELGWNNKNSVLKYGSVYTLSGVNNLKVNTYEIIDLNNSNSTNEITANHTNLVDEIYNNLHGTTIKEMYNKNWNEPYYNGTSVDEINDPDDKYNLQSNEELVGNSSIVELSKNSTETVYWKLSSDTSGNIYLDSSSNLETLKSIQKNKILAQTEDTSSLKDEKALWFENQNQLISRFLESIERNTGDDSSADWVSNGHWYNEAVNLYIKSDLTSIKLGFDKCKRSLVNGLTVKSDSKLDLGTQAVSFGWLLDLPDKKIVGKFNNSDIKLSNPQYILYSKPTYYTTNMTVQDNL